MNRRGSSILLIVIGGIIMVLLWLYLTGNVVSASEQKMDNSTTGLTDMLMGYIESLTVSPPDCEKFRGNCLLDLQSCKTYCTTVKEMKSGLCSSARTSCIEARPCCCVCS